MEPHSPAPATPVGVAVIGLGTVGRRYVEQFSAHDSFVVVGGYDVSTDVAEAASRDFDVTTSDDADALINDPDVGLVYIAVPPNHHELYVDKVVAADTAILCEKPLGVDNETSAAMVGRVEAWGGPAAVNFVYGGAPAGVELRRQIEQGVCGRIVGADLRLHFEQWPRSWQAGATWLRDRDQGGWVREVVSHYIFLASRLFGPATSHRTQVHHPADGSSEQAVLSTVSFETADLRITGSSDSVGIDEVEFTVRGTERSLRLNNWYDLLHARPGQPWSLLLNRSVTGGEAAYAAQLDQMHRLASSEPHSLATFREALHVQVVVESMLA